VELVLSLSVCSSCIRYYCVEVLTALSSGYHCLDVADIKNLSDHNITFEKGSPVSPFFQLLTVLPPHSKLMPKVFEKVRQLDDFCGILADSVPLLLFRCYEMPGTR
jgi:hypothetical protein